MRLTDFEKEVINKLNSSEINDVSSFFLNCIDYKKRESRSSVMGTVHVNQHEIVNFVENPSEALSKTTSFLTLINRLLNEGLLYIIKDKSQIPLKIMTQSIRQSDDTTFEKFYYVVYDYKDDLFIPTIDLKTFVENNYKTRNEVIEEQEKKERAHEKLIELEKQERSFKETRKISYLNLLFTVIITVATSIFNYYTYTNSRKVEIVNSQPSKVEIVNPEIQKAIKNLPENNKPNSDSLIQVSKK